MRFLPAALLAGLLTVPTAAQQLYALESLSSGDGMGISVDFAGDVDNDGVEDVILGAWRDDTAETDAGRVVVLSGDDGSVIWELFGERPSDNFGRGVAGVGDVDGDMFDDFAVGAPYDDAGDNNTGSVTVFSGQFGTEIYKWSSGQADARMGWSVANAGDVDNDGTDDIIMGAPNWLSPGSPGAGAVFIRSGDDETLIRMHEGPEAFQFMGYAVDGAGDLQGIGNHCYTVGSYAKDFMGITNAGRVEVFRGVNGTTLFQWHGDGAGDEFGRAVANAGDVDDDGFDDIIVGAWGDDDNGLESGSAYIFSGDTGLELYKISGTQTGALLGSSVAAAGDVNGDMFDDVLIGSQSEDTPVLNAGRVRLISGADGATVLRTVTGTAQSGYLGWSVAGGRDVDGDLWPDFIVGGPGIVPLGLGTGCARIVTTRPWEDLGFAMVGTPGMPTLNASGPLTDSTTMYSISITGGQPLASPTLVLGYSTGFTNFKGGTMVPTPDEVIGGFGLDGNGDMFVSGSWFDGVPPGFQFIMQFWWSDPAGPKGLISTNGVRATTP